jgi:hypothetical protein
VHGLECVEFHDKSSELKMHDFVLPDQGFYSIKILEEEGPQRASCIINVLSGEVLRRSWRMNSKNLINSSLDWQVKQMEAKEYIVVFRDKNTLETFSKIYEILMSVQGIKVKFLNTNLDLEPDEILQTTRSRSMGCLGLHVRNRS